MKLIEKNKTLKLIEIKGYSIADIFENKELKQACHKGMSIAYNVINDMPTIEAIPIEWIEKKIAKSKEYPNSDDISDCYSLQISEVWGWLLEDWIEENESNTNT